MNWRLEPNTLTVAEKREGEKKGKHERNKETC